MNQVLHIFRKDVRHFWIEIVLSWAVLIYVGRWNWFHSSPHREFRWVYEVQGYAVLLLVFAWWILIARVVQDESLVGDSQFWVTRPYEWKSLLAAKILFAILVIHIPAVLLYTVLLKLAGFPVLASSAGIFQITTVTSLLLLLPIAAFAAVTKSLWRWLIILLVLVFVGIAGIASFSFFFGGGGAQIADEGAYAFLQPIAFVTLLCAAVLLQYARRRLLRAWLLLILAFAAFPLLEFVIPYRMLADRQFPVSSSKPVLLQVMPPTTTAQSPVESGKVYVSLPVSVTGVAENTIVTVRGLIVTIDAPNGRHWGSEWRSAGNEFYPGYGSGQLSFWLDKGFYDAVNSQPSRVHVLLAMDQLRETDRQKIVAEDTFVLPNVGVCWLVNYTGVASAFGFDCRSDGAAPKNLLVTLVSSESTCPPDRDHPVPQTARILSRGGGFQPILPLSTRSFLLSSSDPSDPEARPKICPGTPLDFSKYESFRSTRVEYDLGELRLGEYSKPAIRSGLGGYAVSIP
jgi:hypothetical protein